jgi:hypothetical protein
MVIISHSFLPVIRKLAVISGYGVLDTETVGVIVGVTDIVGVTVGVLVTVGVGVNPILLVGVAVLVGVGVFVLVGVGVFVLVGVKVGVLVTVGVGVGDVAQQNPGASEQLLSPFKTISAVSAP